MKEIIIIDNLKCGGCANTVKKRLEKMDGVSNVNVMLETSTVEVEKASEVSREAIIAKLSKLGYPEIGTTNLMQKAKSYVSCAIGRLDA